MGYLVNKQSSTFNVQNDVIFYHPGEFKRDFEQVFKYYFNTEG